MQLGHALKEFGDYAGAEAAYRKFLRERPFDSDVHLQLGHLFNKAGDSAAALEWYERATQLAPLDDDIAQHAEAARRSAGHASSRDELREAMKCIEKKLWSRARTILHDLVNIEGQENLVGILANVTKETGVFEEAAELYERYRFYAETQAPQLLHDAELQIGHLCKASGDYAGALRHYGRARAHEHENIGYVADDAVCNREVRACVAEIYTCFSDGQRQW